MAIVCSPAVSPVAWCSPSPTVVRALLGHTSVAHRVGWASSRWRAAAPLWSNSLAARIRSETLDFLPSTHGRAFRIEEVSRPARILAALVAIGREGLQPLSASAAVVRRSSIRRESSW